MQSALHFLRFVCGLDEPNTQVTAAELQLLLRHAAPAKVIYEIGCYEGKTSAALARAGAVVHTVDPFFRRRLGICWGEWIAKLHARRTRADVRFVRALSVHVTAPAPIDFIFIDADHRYEAVKADVEHWLPQLRDGGFMALHDCKVAPNSPARVGSVLFYEQEICKIPELREVASVDSLVIFQVRRNTTPGNASER